MTSNNSFSNEESVIGQTILGDRGVEKEISGRVRDTGSSVFSSDLSIYSILRKPKYGIAMFLEVLRC